MIYLDSAATSLWHPKEAEERMIQALRGCGNAGRAMWIVGLNDNPACSVFYKCL